MNAFLSVLTALLVPVSSDANYVLYRVFCTILIIGMLVCALFALIVVLVQPGNSTGIDALGGSSETFYGKNKGKNLESKMKKWTTISIIALAVMAILFYLIQLM